jgi:YYY domain-containing protein
MTQILNAVGWYLLLAALAWLAVPIAYRIFPALADRGYAFARPLGLLLWGFAFWILSSFGLLANDRGGLLTAILLLAALSYSALRGNKPGELRAWLRKARPGIIATEIVFAIAFLFLLWIRARGPEINHTEQPMELAFINAILHSGSMPPHDPWLSGFSISYYYFGYLMVAMLAKLLGVAAPVAFNLGFVMIFSMAATAAYGLLANLLTLYLPQPRRGLHWLAGLAPLFILLLGNAEGLFEILHAQHFFWSADANGTQSSAFWAWMDIKDLVNPPISPPRLAPRFYGDGGYWWWWRASRVINDRTFTGGEQELIDEFPAFSFVLGDLHPHVLSMPFVLMVMGFALNIYLGGAETKRPPPLFNLDVAWRGLVFGALLVGALAFLNIWDLPIYVVLICGAYVLRRAKSEGWTWQRLEEFIALAFLLGLGGIALFLPFFLGFTSQAAGVMPNLLNPTRGAHFWVMFITLLGPVVVFLVFTWRRTRGSWLKPILISFAFLAALWLASLGLALLYARVLAGTPIGDAILSGMGAPDVGSLFSESIRRRLAASGGWLSIGLLLALVGGLFFRSTGPTEKTEPADMGRARSFALLLALVALLLLTAPEFVYLRDQFGTRMNTVFKFYIQAWLMLGIVASFATVAVLRELRGIARALAGTLIGLVLVSGFAFPVYAFSDISMRNAGQPLTLDGSAYLSPDALAAISWLQSAPQGTLAEAVGGSYTGYARYATFAGQPGIMGWPGHEGQWRGGQVDFARIDDIQALYSTQNWDIAQAIIDQYDIQYIVVGDLERNTYQVNDLKFQQNLTLAFQNGQVSIYSVP